MMRSLLVALVLSSTTAYAQLPAETCEVTVVRAPEGARETIEKILATEHCTTSLQVRVIPTTGGLYILATDDHGRVRERVVPDATSAGVLIASWSADDGVASSIDPPSPAPSTWQGPRVSPYGDTFHPPSSIAPESGGFTDEGAPQTDVTHPDQFIAVGVGLGANNASGIRAEIDLVEHAGWTLGVMGSITGQTMQIESDTYVTAAGANVVDYGAAATLGRTVRWDDWHLRLGLGLGVLTSTVNLDQVDYNATRIARGSGTAAGLWVEGAVFLGHSIGDAKVWELEVGPTASYAEQSWDIEDSMSTLTRQAGSFTLVAQLRRGI